MKILVVDDDEDSAALLACILERQGWSVDTVSAVGEARRALQATQYQVLVTDLYLPDGLGIDLLEPPPPGRLIAILVTGAADQAERRRSEALGFHRCLAKPLSGSDLIEAIRSLVKEPGGNAS
jgi:DNA-binding response OmpR family regulator